MVYPVAPAGRDLLRSENLVDRAQILQGADMPLVTDGVRRQRKHFDIQCICRFTIGEKDICNPLTPTRSDSALIPRESCRQATLMYHVGKRALSLVVRPLGTTAETAVQKKILAN